VTERRSYQKTLFDRHGPDAALIMKVTLRAMSAGGLSFPMILALGAKYNLLGWRLIAVAILGPIGVGLLTYRITMWALDRTQEGVSAVLEGSQGSTPYTQQNSYIQTMVMQGRLDDAVAEYERLLTEPGSTVDVRIRAAELNTREAGKHARAAELFREAIRHPGCTAGEEQYCVNRLVDLLTGPLEQPGRALVELRRLADRYPNSVIGDRAKDALRILKARQNAMSIEA
jgi:hypothetical protein